MRETERREYIPDLVLIAIIFVVEIGIAIVAPMMVEVWGIVVGPLSEELFPPGMDKSTFSIWDRAHTQPEKKK